MVDSVKRDVRNYLPYTAIMKLSWECPFCGNHLTEDKYIWHKVHANCSCGATFFIDWFPGEHEGRLYPPTIDGVLYPREGEKEA